MFRPLSFHAESDPGKRIHPSEIFGDVLNRERSRADRLGDELSLLVFSEARHPSSDALEALLEQLRCTDEVGWLDPTTFGVLLPHTAAGEARQVARKLAHSIGDGDAAGYDLVTYPREMLRGDPQRSDRPDPDPPAPGPRLPGTPAPRSTRRARERFGRPTDISINPASRSRIETPIGPAEELGSTNEFAATLGELHRTQFVMPLPRWKRALDLMGAVVGLSLLSPVFLLAALAVKLTSRGPVFFVQMRAGLGGRPFRMCKFRSMIADAETLKERLRRYNEAQGPVFKIADDPRLTWVGKWIRKLSIDELPQLWNVLRGDMSLVGPRPPTFDEVARYTRWQRRRLEITPGLTCLWQVNGRCQIDFENWVRLDIRYSQRRSFLFDLRLLLRTIPAVVTMRGAH